MNKQSAFENIQFVKDWFKTRQTSNVKLEENSEPIEDSNYEEKIISEIKFQPMNPSELYAEFWFADNGAVGFGVERRTKIAELLGYTSFSKRFAGGKEPAPMSKKALGTLLTLIADGRIAVAAVHMPLVGLVSTRLVVGEDDRRMLKDSGFSDADTYFSERSPPLSKLLRFSSWT